MALNINRNVDDMFYRYKMPRLLAKVIFYFFDLSLFNRLLNFR